MHNISRQQNIQMDISPWNSLEVDNQIDKLNQKDIKITKNVVKVLSQKIDLSKQTRMRKFHTIIQQHRQRLLKKHQYQNNKSLWIDSQKNKKTESKSREPSKNISSDIKRSYTSNKFSNDIIDLKIKKAKISDIYEYQREIIKSFYRPKSTFQNADKFYGNLNKNMEYGRSINPNQIVNNKPFTPILILMNKKKNPSKSQSDINQLKSIVQVKLASYGSSKSVQKIKLSEGIKKKISENKVQAHFLDRILTDN